MRWTDKVTYQGKTLNRGTAELMRAADKMLATRRFGSEKSPATLVQGSYNYGVSASAGTHNGGGAGDITAFNWRNRELVYRLLGACMYHRPTLPGVWREHMHFIVDGDGTASDGAKRQVVAYHNRRNGLANNGPDTGPRMLVFPLFVAPWKPEGKTGVFYISQRTQAHSQPTARSEVIRTLSVGSRITVVARVRVGDNIWAVSPTGLLVLASRLSETK